MDCTGMVSIIVHLGVTAARRIMDRGNWYLVSSNLWSVHSSSLMPEFP